MISSRSCCRFVVCTSMMWISCSSTSQRCSIGLRSGDCGGRLSLVNWSDLCYPAGRGHQKMIDCGHKGIHGNNTQVELWHLTNAQLVLRGTKCTRQDRSMLSCCLCQILTQPNECRSRNRDLSDQATFFQSSIVQFWWILASVCCSQLKGVSPVCFFCFKVWCVVCSEMATRHFLPQKCC